MEVFTSDSIGVVATGLLIVGIIKFVYYYKSFNVSILRYIEASEIVLLFADNSTIAGGAILPLIPPYFYSILPYFQASTSISSVFKVRIAIYWELLWPHFIYQVPLGFIFIFITLFRKNIFRFERWRYGGLILLLLGLEFAAPEIIYRAQPNIKPIIMIAILLVINFSFMVLVATDNEIDKVKKHDFFKYTTVEFEKDSSLEQPANSYFIGKVKSFVFFYCPASGESFTYSTSKLKSIKYRPYVPSNVQKTALAEAVPSEAPPNPIQETPQTGTES